MLIMKHILMLSLAVLLLMALAWLLGFRVNVTASMPYGVYRLMAGHASRGQLASFCLESDFSDLARERGYLAAGSCPSGLRPLLKEVAGLPGDVIGFRDGLITLNGQVLAGTGAAIRDSQGRLMPASRLMPGVIAQGMALMLSQQRAESFDSRYYGLVPLTDIKPVKPVFTFTLN